MQGVLFLNGIDNTCNAKKLYFFTISAIDNVNKM